jgi:ADP-heptose:LPS heptosyltransferase
MSTVPCPSKVLLVRAGALGDLLLLRPAITSLRAAGAIVGLVAPAASEVLHGDGLGEAQEVFNWEDRVFARLANGEEADEDSLVARLRAYDAAIAYTANETFVAALRCLVPVVQRLSPTALEPGVHASLVFTRPALALGGLRDIETPIFRARGQDRTGADEWIQRLGGSGFLALHPGSGSVRKNWKAERYADLVESLGHGRPILVVEGPADEAAVAPLRARAGSRAVFARGLPLRTLGTVLGEASLYVGNDSGVSHLAAAWGTPTLALFGPTDPAVWAPVGPRVQVLQAPRGDLDGLDAATVAAAARDALRSWARPRPPCG